MDNDFKSFLELLRAATTRIGPAYFQLPVAGAGEDRYRERVYAYELYHQLRKRWPLSLNFSLGGEVDKKGHPLIRGIPELDSAKPDLLVHVPGRMDRNLAVVEIKSTNVRAREAKKDVTKLKVFLEKADYKGAIYLIYGAEKNGHEVAGRACNNAGIGANVHLLWHRRVGERAQVVSPT